MFLEKKKGIISLALVGCLVFTTEFGTLAANPQSEAQSITINHETQISPLAEAFEQIPEMAELAVDIQEWEGKAIQNTDSQVNILKEAKANGTTVGKSFKNTVLTVVQYGEEWTKVSSGNVTGYVKTSSLVFGVDAVRRAEVTCANGTRAAQKVEAPKPVQTTNKSVSADTSTEKLLAAIIFCEAGNQSYTGKVAVGAVIINRVHSSRFPNTIREVIYQRGQFSPAMSGKLDRVLASGNIPSSCYDAARAALNGSNPIGNALFFNTSSGSFKLGDHWFS